MPRLFLGDEFLGVSLGDFDQIVPMATDVTGRSAFDGDGMGRERGVDHVDRVPRADLGAVLATDASIKIDVAPGLQARMLLAGNFIDAIDRADLNAGLTSGTTVGVNDGQNLGDDLPRFAGK